MTLYIPPAEATNYRVYVEFDYRLSSSYPVSPPFDLYTQTFAGATLLGSPYGVAFAYGYPGNTAYTTRVIKRYHLERPDDYSDLLATLMPVGNDKKVKYRAVDVNLADVAASGVPGDPFVIGEPGDGGSGGGGTGGGTGGGGSGGGDGILDNVDIAALANKFNAGRASWSEELPKLQMARGNLSGDALASNFAGAVLNYLDTLGNYGVGQGYRDMIDRVERKETLLSDYLGRALDFVTGGIDDLRRQLDTGQIGYRDHEKAWQKAKLERLDNDAFDAGLQDLGVNDFARKLLKEFTLSLQGESTIIADFGRKFEALRDSFDGVEAVVGEGIKRIKGSIYDDVIVNADDEVRDGKDKVILGAGDDVYYGGKGRAKIDAGPGNDEVFAFGGNDRIDTGAGFDVVLAGGGKDKVKTGAATDAAAGGGGKDVLVMGAGGDYAYGDGGADRLKGQGGRDELYGGGGRDRLDGGGGKDRLEGGGGNDRLKGGGGNDKLFGGGGKDVFEFQRHAGRDWVRDFEQGEDAVAVRGASFSDLRFERLGFHTVVHWKGEEMVIEGVKPRELTPDDFIF
jgi:Ca2+-binding RTX toxin-like protein